MISPSVHQSISPSVHQSIGPSVHRSISPSVHRSISPSFYGFKIYFLSYRHNSNPTKHTMANPWIDFLKRFKKDHPEIKQSDLFRKAGEEYKKKSHKQHGGLNPAPWMYGGGAKRRSAKRASRSARRSARRTAMRTARRSS